MDSKNYEIKKLPRRDLVKAYVIQKEYVDRKPFSYVKRQYEKWPNLSVGSYDGRKLIGIAFGRVEKDFAILSAIAVKEKYWRKRIGSKMLKFFENQVKELGIKKVSVGAGEEVERFYLERNYKPSLLLVLIRRINLPKNYREKGYKIVEEKNHRNTKDVYIQAEEYEPKMKERVKKEFNAYKAIYIFEKHLNGNFELA